MESERDFYRDLYSHLESREWSDVQIVNLMQKIGRSSLLSCEGVSFGNVYTPAQFRETERYKNTPKDLGGWDITPGYEEEYTD